MGYLRKVKRIGKSHYRITAVYMHGDADAYTTKTLDVPIEAEKEKGIVSHYLQLLGLLKNSKKDYSPDSSYPYKITKEMAAHLKVIARYEWGVVSLKDFLQEGGSWVSAIGEFELPLYVPQASCVERACPLEDFSCEMFLSNGTTYNVTWEES